MSPRTERRARAGAALLPVVATLFTLALVVATITSIERASVRAARLAEARGAAAALADALRDSAIAAIRGGAWPSVGTWDTLLVAAHGDTVRRALVGRPAWDHLVLRLEASLGAGVPRSIAASARRLDLPLDVPFAMPTGALTGARPWEVAGAVLEAHDDDGAAARRCRDTVPAAPVAATVVGAVPPLAAVRAHPAVRRLDPDTVSAPVAGVVLLPAGAVLSRALAVDGVVLVEGDLALAAPLRVRGVLVAAGSVDTRHGGALRLEGAAWAGDGGGGRSRVGVGDTIRWDPCAVRAARARLARPAAVGAWEVARDR